METLSLSSPPLKISLVAALGKNREIGRNNQLLWRIREDLQNFKRLTLGHFILMGRKTYESIGRPLPGRTNLVLTRQADYMAPGCSVVRTLEAAEAMVRQAGAPELFICGGADVYAQALPSASRMYLSWIEATQEADTFFPSWTAQKWRVELDVGFPASDGDPSWRYQVLERI